MNINNIFSSLTGIFLNYRLPGITGSQNLRQNQFNMFQSGLSSQFASINQNALGSSVQNTSNSQNNLLTYAPMAAGLNTFWSSNSDLRIKTPSVIAAPAQNPNIDKPETNTTASTAVEPQVSQNQPKKDLETWMNETEAELLKKQNVNGRNMLTKTDIRILGLIKRNKEGNAPEWSKKELLEMYNMSQMARIKPKKIQ